MSDFLLETPEEKAEFEAVRTETPVQPIEPPREEVKTEPEKAPEPVKTEAEKKPVRLVPHEALHEERVKRQALEKRLAELEAAKPKAEPTQEIDETQDPIGALAQLRAKIRANEEREQQERQQRAQIEDLGRRVSSRVNAYAREHPEYLEQVNFLRQSRAAELRLLGHSDDVIGQQIMQEEMALGAMALERDMDPGAIVANLAQHRGWKAKAAEPPAEQKAALPNPSEAVKTAIAESTAKIERLEKGQRAARSSSASGGGGPSPELSLDQIAELDGAAFDAAFEKVRGLMA